MSRTRRIVTCFLPGRRLKSGDDGMTLIEVIVSLALLITVMATTAGFFTTSLKQSNGQTQAQEAAVLADQQLDYTRSVAGTSLLNGRTQTQVNAVTASPGSVNLSNDIIAAPWPSGSNGNYDPTATGSSTQAVPITIPPQTINGTAYTITTFIDQCYVAYGANGTCTTTNSNNGWVYRITVDVSYQLGGGRSCGASGCQFVASTLRDPGSDPCFNVNVAYAGCSTLQPTITAISPSTVTTNSSNTITLTGTNFDPGATVQILTGGNYGVVSNVTRISSTSLTFTLATANTPAAVGAPTVQLTNPNGKYAYGTMTITTSAINVTTVTPSPITTGSTVTMTISGSGFQSGSLVSIPTTAGTISGTPTITANTITLSFTAANNASAPGTWAATVTNPDGNSASGNFTIQKATITVTAISPATLPWANTRAFTITGTGFNSGAQVTLDGANVNETWVSSTSMTVALTSDAAVGTRTFAVTNPDGGTASKTFTVTVNPLSFATSPDPSTPTNKTFTLTGGTFRSGATVKLDGSSSTISTAVVNSTTQMTVTLTTAPAAGSHSFSVTNLDGGTATDSFMVNPHIATVSPASFAHNTSTAKAISLTGTGFVVGSTTIKVNGSTTGVTNVSVTSATAASFKRIFSTAGTYTIQLFNSDGSISDTISVTVT